MWNEIKPQITQVFTKQRKYWQIEKDLFKNFKYLFLVGDQAGSRTSPEDEGRLNFTKPSTETVARIPSPFFASRR